MSSPFAVPPRIPPPMLSWSRLRFTLLVALPFGVLHSLGSETSISVWIVRDCVVALIVMLAFGIFERWPPKLPHWLARSALQLIAVVIVIPPGAYFAYWLTTGGEPQIGKDRGRASGYAGLVVTGFLFAPWIAVGAMLRQRDAITRDQALKLALERSELERKALDARLRLLQAQVEPHFLFNTLANIQALVEAGSPKAPELLRSLIAYLRAAVPRMHDPGTTLGEEVELVRAYLDVMQMRMPDRLQYLLRIDPEAQGIRCPPMTILTLVENAVRHGIDPSEVGGRVDVDVALREGRCYVRVSDTGVGLRNESHGLGTGLATLRERLQLAFGPDVQLKLFEAQPHGVCAEMAFPAHEEHT